MKQYEGKKIGSIPISPGMKISCWVEEIKLIEICVIPWNIYVISYNGEHDSQKCYLYFISYLCWFVCSRVHRSPANRLNSRLVNPATGSKRNSTFFKRNITSKFLCLADVTSSITTGLRWDNRSILDYPYKIKRKKKTEKLNFKWEDFPIWNFNFYTWVNGTATSQFP